LVSNVVFEEKKGARMHINHTNQPTNQPTSQTNKKKKEKNAAQHNVLRATVVRRPHKQSVVPHGFGLEFPDDLVPCLFVKEMDKQCS
jgi:hypothetical protein